MKLKVCIAVATGWVGQPFCPAMSHAGDLSLVGAVSRNHHGRKLRDVFGGSNLDLTVNPSLTEAPDVPTDAQVDDTKAAAFTVQQRGWRVNPYSARVPCKEKEWNVK
ncbi:MAG TPA: hypothetical protein VF666_12800 [Pyrinomonadaceae bacterium]|jgi:4-hydroxy-tetrahydrodipicolinate reductase